MINIQKPCTATLVLSSKRKKKKKAEYSHPIQSVLGQFCDVAKVGIIQARFSQIWLQDKYESTFFEASFHIFGYLLEPCSEIWPKIKKKKVGQILVIENHKKELNFSTFIFISLFGYI
jgi:hypothetical protein